MAGPFYAAHHVDEVVIVDPQARAVTWLGSAGGSYQPLAVSGLIDLGQTSSRTGSPGPDVRQVALV